MRVISTKAPITASTTTRPHYDEAAAKEAWRQTLDWLNKYLRT